MINPLNFRCISIMEKKMDNSQDERHRKGKIVDTVEDENKKKEERLRKARERSKRYREKKRNKDVALIIGGLTDADREKREERLRYDREKSKRYREKKKNEAAKDRAHSSSDSTASRIKKERQKQNSKRYRDKIRILNLLTHIYSQKNVSHSIHSSQKSS